MENNVQVEDLGCYKINCSTTFSNIYNYIYIYSIYLSGIGYIQFYLRPHDYGSILTSAL